MLSICVVTQQYGKIISGIGLHAQILVRQLIKDGHNVTILAPSGQFIDRNLPASFFEVPYPIFANSQARWIALSWWFARVLREISHHFDIVHFTEAREALFHRNHMASVGNANDTYAAESKSIFYYRQFYKDWPIRWLYYCLVRICEKRTLPRLHAIIANSHYTAEILKSRYPITPDRLWVCYKAIDLEQYVHIRKAREHSSRVSSKRILFVGGNMQRKGLPTLIRAAPQVLAVFPEAEFWVVGEDRFVPHMKKLCHSLGVSRAFRFWGWKSREELLEIYSQADVFVMPSLVEALGVAFLEAMACGLPVIGTKVGGIPEIIEHGRNGLLVEPNNAQQLSAALIEVLKDDNLRQKLIKEGFDTVIQFNVERMMNCTYKVYESILRIALMEA